MKTSEVLMRIFGPGRWMKPVYQEELDQSKDWWRESINPYWAWLDEKYKRERVASKEDTVAMK